MEGISRSNPSKLFNIPRIEEDPTPLSFNWGDQYMEDIPTTVESHIAMKELELLREYETHQGHPLVINSFWTVRILLAHDTQAKAQISHGIREALTLIRRGQQESSAGFQLME